MTYPMKYRQKAMKLRAEGVSRAEVAYRMDVGVMTVYRWEKELAPKRQGSRPWKLNKEALARHVAEHPDMYLKERARHFGVGTNTVWVAMQVLGLSRKKNVATSQSR
jgi:transposase